MGRQRKMPDEQFVNVGLKVHPDVKKALLAEAENTGVAEGALARRYLILGMRNARSSDPVINAILQLIEKMPESDRADIFAIIDALYKRRAGISGEQPTLDTGRYADTETHSTSPQSPRPPRHMFEVADGGPPLVPMNLTSIKDEKTNGDDFQKKKA